MRATLTLILALLTLAPMQAAEKPPLEVTAELGFGNHFLEGRPFPIQIDLSGAKLDIDGALRVIAHNSVGGETVLETPVALSSGAHKRWRFTLPPIVSNRVKVQVVDRRGALLAEQEFFGLSVAASLPLVVVVQHEFNNRFTFPRSANERVSDGAWRSTSVDPSALPDDPLAYAGVAAVLWRADKENALDKAQAQALVHWIKQGGLLVVVGGRTVAPNFPREFSFPSQWGEVESFDARDFANARMLPPNRAVTMLARPRPVTSGKGTAREGTIAVRPLRGKEESQRMIIGNVSLMSEEPVAGGAIMQLAFDPQDLATQGSPLGMDFWEQVLSLPETRRSPWVTLSWLTRLARDTSRVRLAELANYRVEPVWRIAWVFGAFFGAAFCLNFWLFRKSRRYEWAWLILIVAAVGLFLFNRAFGRVGGFGPTRQIEITRSFGVAGEKPLLSFTETGLLSPALRETKIATVRLHHLFLGLDAESRAIQSITNRLSYPVRLRPGAFNTCSTVCYDELPGNGIELTWKRTTRQVEIQLANKTGMRLLNPRFSPIGGSTRMNRGDTFTMTIPNGVFENWMLSALNTQTVENEDPFYPGGNYGYRLPQSDMRALPGDGTYSGPMNIRAEDDGIERQHFLFRFELPENTVPLTVSDAREVRCRRTVTLFIPITAMPYSMSVAGRSNRGTFP